MTAEKRFFDTNIVLYTLSGDTRKADLAERFLSEGGVVSVQVLNEIASVASRKLGLGWNEIEEILQVVRTVCSVRPLTIDTHETALAFASRYGYSFYDCLILASAAEAGASTLLSEDMQHGQLVGPVRIVNPFVAP
jgi:predicted nucleic acid-binding protein